MSIRKVQGVIFDLDMCIFDTRTLGEHYLDPILKPLRESSVPKEKQTEIEYAFWTNNLEDTVRLFQIPNDVAESMRVAHRGLVVPEWVQTYGDEQCILSLPVYRVLVTSGYRVWQEGKIKRLEVARLFEEVIIDAIDNAELRIGKKAIFQDLMARHAWHPQDVLVVGDNPHSELKAGKELGMRTVQTLRPTIQRADGFDHYIHSLHELLPLVGGKPL